MPTFSLFLVALVGLLTLGHGYLYRRLVGEVFERRTHRQVGAAVVAVGAILVFTRLFSAFFRVHLPRPLALFVGTWMGVSLYALLTLLTLGSLLSVYRLTRRLLKAACHLEPESPERRRFLAQTIAIGASAVTVGVSAYGSWRAFEPAVVSELGVGIRNLPRGLDGLKIVQISDIHLGDILQVDFFRDLIERCNALKPDLVALTGDLVDGSVPQLGSTAAELMRLKTRFGTFFCTGNHEYYSGDVAWVEALTRMGVVVLRNRHVSVGEGAVSLDLIGVDDWGQRRLRTGGGYNLAKALEGRNPERASVLLAHQPTSFPDAVNHALGLQLSGHTHNGQLFPFTLLAKAVHPYCVGHYQRADTHLYVNRGAGFWGPAMRVGSPPEITALTLMAT